MARNPKQQQAALRLHKQGMPVAKIASKLKISARTIQRWLKAESPIPVRVEVLSVDNETVQNDAAIGASGVGSEDFDLSVSRRTAIRLLKLSESAITAIEECLANPDARTADKLKAAQIAGFWLGIGAYPQNCLSVIERVERTFSVSLAEEGDDVSSTINTVSSSNTFSTTNVTTEVDEADYPKETRDWMAQEEAKHQAAIEQERLANSLRKRLGG